MRIKQGVKIGELHSAMGVALQVANDLYKLFNIECVITSGRDSTHAPGSAHFRGRAVDLRTRDFQPQTLRGIEADLRIRLGAEYYVLLESDHIHIQFNG